MKILYISHTHPPKDKPLENLGGMQNVSMQLMKTVKDRGDVEIETILLQTTWRFIGFKTFFFLISLLWRVPSAIKKNRPDVVLFSSMVTASIIPFLSKKTPVP
ncbi:MAG: glycosyltransferase family 4 protein, partial [Balneolaceae bacterium]